LTSDIWVPGILPEPDSLPQAEQDALFADVIARLPAICERAETWAASVDPLLGRFPIDEPADAVARWMLGFFELREAEVFAPLWKFWDHCGLSLTGPQRLGPEFVWHLPIIRFTWFSEAMLAFRLSWMVRTFGEPTGWHWWNGMLFPQYPKPWDQEWMNLWVFRDQENTEVLLFLFMKHAGVRPWYRLPSDGPTYDIELSRDEDGWNIGFDPQQRDDESDDDFMVRRGAAVEVLVSALGGLPKVKSVMADDRDLIVVEGGGRSFKKELKVLIEQVGGPLAGMKIDPDVENNR
jgi:hypothetical protein